MDWYNSLTPIGESLAGLSKLFGFGGGAAETTAIGPGTGTGRGGDPRFYDPRSSLYQGGVTAAAAADQARENAFRLGGMSNQITSGSPAARAAMAASAANPMDFAGPAQAAMTAARANPYDTFNPSRAAYDFSRIPSASDLAMRAASANPYDVFNPAQAAMTASAANPIDFASTVNQVYMPTNGKNYGPR
tara:strand:- start:316 stop:885 length:570 start_codon:yes stop_codon:yes gene_type:complete